MLNSIRSWQRHLWTRLFECSPLSVGAFWVKIKMRDQSALLTLLLCLLPAREAAWRVFSEAMASAADDTLRKPLSRLLCVTLTVMQTNRPQIHSTHCPVRVISQKKGLFIRHAEYRKTQIFVLFIRSWTGRKGSWFLHLSGLSYSNRIYYLLSQAHVHGGGVVAVPGSIPLCRLHRHGVKSLDWLVLVIRPASHYTHSGREVRPGSRSQPVNLIQMWDVTVMCNRHGTPSKHIWRCWRGRHSTKGRAPETVRP